MTAYATLWRAIAMLLLIGPATAAPSTADTIGQILTSTPAETVLLVCGGVFLLLSILTLGSGVAEALCFGSFGLLFVGRYLQGEDPWLPMGLLVGGALCLLAEVFVLPGFGVCGIVGVACIATMTILIAGSTTTGLLIFMLSTFCSVAAGFLAVKLIPNLRVTRKLFVLPTPEPDDVATVAGKAVYLPMEGEVGVASSSLRPQGYAMFGSQRVDVASENEFVSKGQAVKVVRIEGARVVVRSVPTSPSHPETQGG